MSHNPFDLIVIGAGSAGVRLARMAATSGSRVAIIEKSAFGGTCVNLGCVPKKLFVYASHFPEDFSDASGFGWSFPSEPVFGWDTLRENKNREIARLNGIYQRLLENAGVEIFTGHARFASPSEVLVNDEIRLQGSRVVIACGGKPRVPAFPGSEYVFTSNEAFHLEKLPRSLLIVGGGYIAVEFAGIFNGLGVDVTQFYRRELFLRGFDVECRELLADEVRAKGIDLQFNTDVASIAPQGEGFLVKTVCGETRRFDAVMYATGRVPVTDTLGLENTGVGLDDNGFIKVDENFQTAEPGVYALGDVCGTMALTPVATAQAMKLLAHWRSGEAVSFDYEKVPSAIFSQPNMATVGITEELARTRYPNDIDIYKAHFRHMKHTLSGRQEKVFMKLIVQRSTDKVLGAHMIGPDAGEVIQGIAVALVAGATKSQFDQTIGIHPTMAEEFVTLRTPS